MPVDSPLPIVFSHARISVSFYWNLHCEHGYVPEDYRDQYKSLLEPSQLSVEEMTNFVDLLVDRCSLRKVSLTGGEPLLKRGPGCTPAFADIPPGIGAGHRCQSQRLLHSHTS